MISCTKPFLGLLAAATLAGCAAYKIEPPAGFALVSDNSWETRMKAGDNVGLSVRRYENVKGGTLVYWATDLVTKLGKRGYALTAQSPVKSKNGREGARFDFDYAAPGNEDKPKFFTIALFVTDKYKVVVDIAGNKEFAATHRANFDAALRDLKVRGCKAASKICGGPQPGKLSTPPPDVIPDGPPDIVPSNAPANPPPAAVTPAPAPAAPPP